MISHPQKQQQQQSHPRHRHRRLFFLHHRHQVNNYHSHQQQQPRKWWISRMIILSTISVIAVGWNGYSMMHHMLLSQRTSTATAASDNSSSSSSSSSATSQTAITTTDATAASATTTTMESSSSLLPLSKQVLQDTQRQRRNSTSRRKRRRSRKNQEDHDPRERSALQEPLDQAISTATKGARKDSSSSSSSSSSFTASDNNNSAMIASILAGEVHLIFLEVDEDELEQTEIAKEKYNNKAARQQRKKDRRKSRNSSVPPPEYGGIYGRFCKLDWSLHKNNPSSYPMFKDLIAASPDCHETDNDDEKEKESKDEDENNKQRKQRRVNIYELVQQARKYDQNHPDKIKVLNMTAAVFHESRCGSTLTANLFAAVNPTAHRVYSEATPPAQAIRQICGEDYSTCSIDTATALFRDVMYLMSRSNDMEETRVFFKFQPLMAWTVPIFTTVFPTTPYMMIYRDPVQVMMSHLKRGVEHGNCLRNRRRELPPTIMEMNVVMKHGDGDNRKKNRRTKSESKERKQQRQYRKMTEDLIPEDYCAVHLASVMEIMLQHMTTTSSDHHQYGIPINYVDLPDKLYTDILPQLIGPISPTQQVNMENAATIYSKNRGGDRVPGGTFESDSERKEQLASDNIRKAAATYLLPSYQAFEAMTTSSSSVSSIAQQQQE